MAADKTGRIPLRTPIQVSRANQVLKLMKLGQPFDRELRRLLDGLGMRMCDFARVSKIHGDTVEDWCHEGSRTSRVSEPLLKKFRNSFCVTTKKAKEKAESLAEEPSLASG